MILAGLWILSYTWVTDSLQQRRLLPESAYEIIRNSKAVVTIPYNKHSSSNSSNSSSNNTAGDYAPRRAREMKEQLQQQEQQQQKQQLQQEQQQQQCQERIYQVVFVLA